MVNDERLNASPERVRLESNIKSQLRRSLALARVCAVVTFASVFGLSQKTNNDELAVAAIASPIVALGYRKRTLNKIDDSIDKYAYREGKPGNSLIEEHYQIQDGDLKSKSEFDGQAMTGVEFTYAGIGLEQTMCFLGGIAAEYTEGVRTSLTFVGLAVAAAGMDTVFNGKSSLTAYKRQLDNLDGPHGVTTT